MIYSRCSTDISFPEGNTHWAVLPILVRTKVTIPGSQCQALKFLQASLAGSNVYCLYQLGTLQHGMHSAGGDCVCSFFWREGPRLWKCPWTIKMPRISDRENAPSRQQRYLQPGKRQAFHSRLEAVPQTSPPSGFCLISGLDDLHISLDKYNHDESLGWFWLVCFDLVVAVVLTASCRDGWAMRVFSHSCNREQRTHVHPCTHTNFPQEHHALSVRAMCFGHIRNWGLGLKNLSLRTSNTNYHLSSGCLL